MPTIKIILEILFSAGIIFLAWKFMRWIILVLVIVGLILVGYYLKYHHLPNVLIGGFLHR